MKNKILVEFHGWTIDYCVYYFFIKALKKMHENAEVEAFFSFPSFFRFGIYRKFLTIFFFYLGNFLSVRKFKKFKSLGVNKIFMPSIKYRHKVLAKVFFNKNKYRLTRYNLLNLKIDNILIGDLIYDTYLKSFNAPTLNINEKIFEDFFIYYVSLYYYWVDYFKKNSVKSVIVVHASYFTGLPLRIASFNSIKAICASWTYAYSLYKERIYPHQNYLDYKKIFQSLKNKKDLRKLSHKKIEARLNGGRLSAYSYLSSWTRNKNTEQTSINLNSIINKNKIRVLISPHLFSDSPHVYGKLLFDDCYQWLVFLLNLSKRTNYIWFIKTHPDIKNFSHDNSLNIIKDLLKSFPNVVLLESKTSHHYIINQIKIKAVFTMFGTVGHEYPYFNIPVINASVNNPHINNNFCINPRSKSELEKIILNISKIKFKIDIKELIDFNYMHKIYFNKGWLGINIEKFIAKNGGLKKLNLDKQIDLKLLLSIKNHDKVLHKVKNFLNSGSYSL
jgi:hypothetical protein